MLDWGNLAQFQKSRETIFAKSRSIEKELCKGL
jgi:hypothetical protein